MSDNLENLFNELQNNFDFEEPTTGHKQRLVSKLNMQDRMVHKVAKKRFNWQPLIGIAASIILIIALVIGNDQEANASGLASVSPQMAQTQDFFTTTISAELKKLENAKNPETQLLIQDALNQLKRLEIEYESLTSDLNQSGHDQRVIYAMITNFQNRIDILQNTLKQIEIVEQLKNNTNENNNTI